MPDAGHAESVCPHCLAALPCYDIECGGCRARYRLDRKYMGENAITHFEPTTGLLVLIDAPPRS